MSVIISLIILNTISCAVAVFVSVYFLEGVLTHDKEN